MLITRRSLLKFGLTALFLPVFLKRKAKVLPGKIYGANSSLGHRLRFGNFPATSSVVEADVLIVGGGISALAAAYQLQKKGIKKVIICELEDTVGGNSISGQNEIASYPWGAHYVPILNPGALEVVEFFKELGIIKNKIGDSFEYDERYLCWDPEERLYINGRWQDGLVPDYGLNENERAEIKHFFLIIAELKVKKGSDGKYLFDIPLKNSSVDLKALDQLSFLQWYTNNGFKSKPLKWYLDYCVRDDFGGSIEQVSAWAGLHYFCSRRGEATNAKAGSVLTWPAGNGWLLNNLRSKITSEIKTKSICYQVNSENSSAEIYDSKNDLSFQIKAKSIILATPHFITARLLGQESFEVFKYTPWVVANLTLNTIPKGTGAPFSWDNVIYESKFLGYVNAKHQEHTYHTDKTVVTYYYACNDLTRNELQELSLEDLQHAFVSELLKVNPELENQIVRCDLWIWGHGMITPVPNFIWGTEREKAKKHQPPIFFAHTDLTGISIFEEAFTIGVETANDVVNFIESV